MQIFKRKWQWVCVLVLACAVSLLAWVTQPPERDLLARATKVTGVQIEPTIHPYDWLSNHELLLFHYLPGGSWSLSRYDLAARKETPLAGLSTLYRQSGADYNGCTPRISPDEKYFLWTNRKSQIFGSDLEGRTLSQWKRDPGWSDPAWLDNTHWATLKTDKDALKLLGVDIHNVTLPDVSQRILFTPPFNLRSRHVTEYPCLTLTSNRHIFELLTRQFEEGQPHPLMGTEFALDPFPFVQRAYSFPVSQQLGPPFFAGATQSPLNGRVAFALLYQPPPAVLAAASTFS